MVYGKLNGSTVLLVAHGSGFTSGTRNDDGIRMLLYLVINNPAQFFKVNAIFRIRSDDCYTCATKNRFFHEKASPASHITRSLLI